MQSLSKFVLNISMNKEQNWTLERWHIRAAFRRANVIVPETAIEMPDHVITGPDMKLEGKEFFITVTVSFVKTYFLFLYKQSLGAHNLIYSVLSLFA